MHLWLYREDRVVERGSSVLSAWRVRPKRRVGLAKCSAAAKWYGSGMFAC